MHNGDFKRPQFVVTKLGKQQGFAYIWLLLAITLLALGLGRWAEDYAMVAKRTKEAELLRIGHTYQIALGQYYQNSQGNLKIYPNELKDLLNDPRSLRFHRYIRKLDLDPVTGEPFQVLRDADGRIVGVFSASNQKPVKQKHFAAEMKDFEQAAHYSDWKFMALIDTQNPLQTDTLSSPLKQ
ncbi:type II secretion system protein [Aquirhabdus parva]|uniref:Type II secretion system protein n=2 Tax=Aquirhabdus parva TaxID=2283318 RepID=A0A345P2H2_9GAMM|nr:type II secretion system protein [Aquirhabdus parva]